MELESLLQEINSLLEPLEDKVIEHYKMPRYPVVLVVGCPRCGSTLMLQWLANTGKFAYPTNLLSRFYSAPYIGAKIQQLFTDPRFNFKNELSSFSKDIFFSSELGKTTGFLSPNEFWYFWRRFFPYGEIQYLDEKKLKKINTSKFLSEFAAIEAVFDKPFALKGMIINWNIPFISRILDKALFIHITRHPLYNSQSLLESRIKYFGNVIHWYSFKPKEYFNLKNLDPYDQVAGQVYFTNRAVSKGLEIIDESRRIEIAYEAFCKHPADVFNQIKSKFSQQDFLADWPYDGPEKFQSKNQLRLSKEETDKIVNAYSQFSGEYLKQ